MKVRQPYFLNSGVHTSILYNKKQVKYQITKTENSHHKQLELPRREKQDIQSQELNALLLREKYIHIPTQNPFLVNRAQGAGNSLIETLYYLDKTELDYLFVY